VGGQAGPEAEEPHDRSGPGGLGGVHAGALAQGEEGWARIVVTDGPATDSGDMRPGRVRIPQPQWPGLCRTSARQVSRM